MEQDRRVPTKGKAAVKDMSMARGDRGAAGEMCEMGTVGQGDVGKKGDVGGIGKTRVPSRYNPAVGWRRATSSWAGC